MMSANQRIKEIRQYLNLSQAKFAKGIFVSSGYLAGIELGKRKVNERIAKLISFTYGVNENWLRSGNGEMFIRVEDEKLEKLTACFKQLTPDFQEYILKQIEELLILQNKKIDTIPFVS